jgi:L-threonylcarbamoyladenylate synthase
MSVPGAALVLATHTPALFAAAVRRAVDLLRAGEVVALPTETVYGLAANALDPVAVQRIYELKGRPAHNPIIIHVAGLELARRCVSEWPRAAEEMARAFWPGPVTIVLRRAREIPEVVTAGGHTVGLRWPAHPFIQAVIRECGFPLAAPSANLSNRVSPTEAVHVREAFGDRLALIVDGGGAQVGIESTVVDLTVQPARILRPGMVHRESLRAVLGKIAGEQASAGVDSVPGAGSLSEGGGRLRSPGQLERHYSPRARLVVLHWADESDLAGQAERLGIDSSTARVLAHGQIPAAAGWGGVSVIPHDAEAYARALYAELHRCDLEGAQSIIVEAVPTEPAWQGIADRLRRAER